MFINLIDVLNVFLFAFVTILTSLIVVEMWVVFVLFFLVS